MITETWQRLLLLLLFPIVVLVPVDTPEIVRLWPSETFWPLVGDKIFTLGNSFRPSEKAAILAQMIEGITITIDKTKSTDDDNDDDNNAFDFIA